MPILKFMKSNSASCLVAWTHRAPALGDAAAQLATRAQRTRYVIVYRGPLSEDGQRSGYPRVRLEQGALFPPLAIQPKGKASQVIDRFSQSLERLEALDRRVLAEAGAYTGLQCDFSRVRLPKGLSADPNAPTGLKPTAGYFELHCLGPLQELVAQVNRACAVRSSLTLIVAAPTEGIRTLEERVRSYIPAYRALRDFAMATTDTLPPLPERGETFECIRG